ncbi:MAG: pentapeptide repeat-containing protein [Thermodesulfobacteriota bacterium]
MSACKDKYQWCKDEPFVEGTEYCVFHAPKGEKGEGVTPEKFNEKVFKKINGVIRENNLPGSKGNKICNLSGTIFEGGISFDKYDKSNPLPELHFYDATFNGEADFRNVTFNGEADFFKTTFSGWADFFEVTFSGWADFSYAIFGGEADFLNATFNGEADFFKTIFNGEADFRDVTFNGEAEFSSTKFNGGAYFRAGKKGLFKKGADFINFSVKEKVRFEGVNLEKVSFYDSDLRKADFTNCEWPKKDYRWLPSFIMRRIRPEYRRNVLYDENKLFDKRNNKENKIDEGEIEKVEILYRRLKQKYTDEHDWPEVSNWHYGEKEMYRKGSRFRRFLPFSTSNLYWAFGGYGERPVRAGLFLLFLIALISVLTGFTCFEPSSENYVYEGIIKKSVAYLLNTLQYATFQKETIFTPVFGSLWAEAVALFARVIIPLQAALFVLAVRNRFRR